MSRNNEDLIDSDFEDISSARERISKVLVGRKIISTSMVEDTSIVEFDDGLVLISRISDFPDSGFLYSLQFHNGPVLETVDGISVKS